MDRRRYTPSAEGLEGRALLSLFGVTTPSTKNHIVSIQDLPETFQQRFNRVDHLPYYLRQTAPGRFLPKATIKQLQTDMLSVVESVHNSSPEATLAFNQELRNLLPYQTVSPANAVKISNAFGNVLSAAGATPQQVSNLQNDMNGLVQVDVLSSEASILVREDYALVLQTTMSVGRLNQSPTHPTLAISSGLRAKDSAGGVTFNHNPMIVGTYQAGATKIGYVLMQVWDENGTLLGTGVVDPGGSYDVKLNYLPDGKYKLHTQTVDEAGYQSLPSPYPFVLNVKEKPSLAHTVQPPARFTPIETTPTVVVRTQTTSTNTTPIVTTIQTPAGLTATQIAPVVTTTESSPLITPPMTIPIVTMDRYTPVTNLVPTNGIVYTSNPNAPLTPVILTTPLVLSSQSTPSDIVTQLLPATFTTQTTPAAASTQTTPTTTTTQTAPVVTATLNSNPTATSVVTTQPAPVATTSRSTIAIVNDQTR